MPVLSIVLLADQQSVPPKRDDDPLWIFFVELVGDLHMDLWAARSAIGCRDFIAQLAVTAWQALLF